MDGAGTVWAVGSSYYSGASNDFAIWKYDSAGNLAAGFPKYWDNGSAIRTDRAYGVALDGAGNVWAVGASQKGDLTYDFALWKYDSAGNPMAGFPKLWNNAIINANDYGYGIAVDGAGNVWAVGVSNNGAPSYDDFTLWKFDGAGNLAVGFPKFWNNASASNYDYGRGVTVDGAGNIWAVGYSSNGATSDDFALWKFDSAGNLSAGFPKLWNNASANSYDRGYGVAADGAGNVWAVGTTFNGASWEDFALWKYDSAGTLAVGFPKPWNSANGTDVGRGAAVDGAGNVWAVGYALSGGSQDFALWQYDSAGNLATGFPKLWDNTPAGSTDQGYGVAADASGNIWAVGYTYGSTFYDFALWKYSTNVPPVIAALSVTGFRNTSSTSIVVTGSNFIWPMTMELLTSPPTVLNTTLVSPSQVVAVVPAGLPVGIYQVRVKAAGGTTTSGAGLSFSALLDEAATQTVTITEQTVLSRKVFVDVPPHAFTVPVIITIGNAPLTVSATTQNAADAATKTGTALMLPSELDDTVREIRALDAQGVAVNPTKEVSVSIPYNTLTVKTWQTDSFRVVRLNPQTTTWELAAPYGRQAVDKVAGQVKTPVTSFSVFRLAAAMAPAISLDQVKMYDNPTRLGAAGTLVRWRDLTANATIDIYDASGERVILMEPGKSGPGWRNDNVTGRAIWDGRNADGDLVGRGLYFVVMTDGGQRKVLKLAVLR